MYLESEVLKIEKKGIIVESLNHVIIFDKDEFFNFIRY
jgi:hypothetical protein